MVGRTVTGKGSKKTKFTKKYKGWEVVERHECCQRNKIDTWKERKILFLRFQLKQFMDIEIPKHFDFFRIPILN